MGDFMAEIHLGNITGGDMHPVTALVDTGATESAFPADLLEYGSIYRRRNGRWTTSWPTAPSCGVRAGYARISITVRSGETFSSVCPVAFWPDESGQCIGATTLRILTLAVDPVHEELAPVSALRRGWAGDIPVQR